MSQFLQAARERMKKKGTVGSFSRKAAEQGESTQEYASQEYHAPGTLGQEARYAYLAGHHFHGKDDEQSGKSKMRKAMRG